MLLARPACKLGLRCVVTCVIGDYNIGEGDSCFEMSVLICWEVGIGKCMCVLLQPLRLHEGSSDVVEVLLQVLLVTSLVGLVYWDADNGFESWMVERQVV